jgi:adenylylsulfate kinase
MGHPSYLLWFTGLSGSGKSTIASIVEKELFKKGIHTYILDGDALRTGLNKDLDFTDEGRTENIRRIGEVSKLFLDAGIVVIAAFVSPFQKDRAAVREIVGPDKMIEIFVDTSLEECERRDVKGLYSRARKGEIPNFTGISSPFERPLNPDIELKTDGQTAVESSQEVLNHLLKIGLVK